MKRTHLVEDRQFEVEDRTAREPPAVGAGLWVVWEVRQTPFPHKSFQGAFANKADAEGAMKQLTQTM